MFSAGIGAADIHTSPEFALEFALEFASEFALEI
jgi:hypothetical protein